MLSCSRCGSHKFVFTMRGDKYGEHHGAICARCSKRLNSHDLFARSVSILTTCGKTDHNNLPDCHYLAKSLHQ